MKEGQPRRLEVVPPPPAYGEVVFLAEEYKRLSSLPPVVGKYVTWGRQATEDTFPPAQRQHARTQQLRTLQDMNDDEREALVTFAEWKTARVNQRHAQKKP